MNKRLIKSITTFVLALSWCQYASAVPANDKPFTVRQPDGSLLTIILQGDEHAYFAMTEDSVVLAKNSRGFYCYAEKQEDGVPVAGKTIARNQSQRTASEQNLVANIKRNVLNADPTSPMYVLSKADGSKRMPPLHRMQGNPNVPSTGDFKGLVILANFANMKFADAHDNALYQQMMNQEGFDAEGADGSVSDYFKAQSSGRFNTSFDVVGPVDLSHDYEYYGSDASSSATDIHAADMIKEACQLADETTDVDFSKYDNNGDGQVDMVYVIYAGYSQSNGAPSTTVWPHMYYLNMSNNQIELDGVKVNCYATGGERMGTSGTNLMGIGLICHEFSHTLGLPDIYGNGLSYITLANWDVMDKGCYNNDSHTPSGYTAFEKKLLNWITPVDLSEVKGAFTLRNLGNSGDAAMIVNPSNKNEYYLFETHSKSNKFDSYLQGEGMLMIHVDYDSLLFDNNEVNTAEKARMAIVSANGSNSSATSLASVMFGQAGAPANITDLTEVSTVFPDGTEAGVPIKNITMDGGEVSFTVNDKLPAPMLAEETEVSETRFKAHWTKVAGAKRYQVRITAKSTGEQKLRGPFSDTKCTFSNLDPGETYTYEVRCRDDYAWSEWSQPRTIDMAAATGIETSPQVQGARREEWFDAMGRKVGKAGHGIYIKHDGQVAKKVLVK